MTDDQLLSIIVKGVGIAAIFAFTPAILYWLGKRGFHYRSMKEQREYEAEREREKQQQ